MTKLVYATDRNLRRAASDLGVEESFSPRFLHQAVKSPPHYYNPSERVIRGSYNSLERALELEFDL